MFNHNYNILYLSHLFSNLPFLTIIYNNIYYILSILVFCYLFILLALILFINANLQKKYDQLQNQKSHEIKKKMHFLIFIRTLYLNFQNDKIILFIKNFIEHYFLGILIQNFNFFQIKFIMRNKVFVKIILIQKYFYHLIIRSLNIFIFYLIILIKFHLLNIHLYFIKNKFNT